MRTKREEKTGKSSKKALIGLILFFFFLLGCFVFFIAARITGEMSQSAIANLSESLDLLKGTIEVILEREADYQRLIAKELSGMENPEEFIRSYDQNDTMVKLSLLFTGEEQGVSNTGEAFMANDLDFSAGSQVNGLSVSASYVNSMGTWAYTMRCPVVRGEEEIGTLYIEYIYDSFEDALPEKLYNSKAALYFMDRESERFLLKPRGIGERVAGHLNLEDFYRANNILEPAIQEEVGDSIRSGKSMMFYHDIKNKNALIYMWPVNGGSLYLIGYVPIEAIQREGKAVNQNIYTVVAVMLVAFSLCCLVYLFYERQQSRLRKEQEQERETHNQQLAEALQAAQAANSSKTMFLSNMSHDIRTPMNAILGFTTLLAKDAENPAKVKEYTKKITASGQHLLGLINDVLDVSKIESGKAVLTIGEFLLSDLIASIDAIIRPAAKNRNQSFNITVSGVRHEALLGDETRINQILINLLSNAVKYTQEGGSIWLRIFGLEQRSSQYERLRIEVEDNGFGMTPEYLEIIFDAFTRAENSTTNKVQGTGLGMAITKNIVEMMGGTIEVKSKVNEGSLFTVELELRIAEQEQDEFFWERHGISRILVVDDDREACKGIRVLMDEEAGVQVETCYQGSEAIEAIRASGEAGTPYQLILLDRKLSEGNGIETARSIRANIPERIPIVLLTAYDWDRIEGEALQAGIDGFLAKPFFVSALKEKVKELTVGQEAEDREEPENVESLTGYHFLVAEDNEINYEILREVLSIEGATCEIVVNGEQAVERFSQASPEEFDAILMDVQMPVMNGYEATKQIRALKREDAGTIPIIAMTANAFAEDVRDALSAGMNAHVAKPVDLELLKKTIHQYAKRKEADQ